MFHFTPSAYYFPRLIINSTTARTERSVIRERQQHGDTPTKRTPHTLTHARTRTGGAENATK